MINIVEMAWENILGYGNYTSKISFDNYKGVCFIHGEHDGNELREEGDEKLNGSGKSSIVEVLVWCLFGHLTKKINPGDAIINWHTGKNAKARIKTNDNYEIVRMRKFEGVNELLIFKDGVDITRSTSKPAQQFINEIFKIDYNTFIRSRIFAQSSVGFMGLPESKMRAVLEKMMCIDNINPISQTAKSKSDGVSKEIDLLNTKIENIDSEIESILHRIESLKVKDSEFSELKNSKIDDIRSKMVRQKSELDQNIEKINDKIKSKTEEKDKVDYINSKKLKKEWDEYEKYKQLCEETNEKINEIDDLIKTAEKKKIRIETILESHRKKDKYNIDDIKSALSLYDKHSKNLEILNEKILEFKLEINNKETLMSQEEEFLKGEFDGVSKCSKCKSVLTKEHIIYEKNNSNKLIEQYKKDISSYKNKIKILKDKISKIQNEQEKIEIIQLDEAIEYNQNIDQENEKQNEHKKQLKLLDEELIKYNYEKDECASRINTKVNKPSVTLNEAETINKYLDNIDNEILTYKKNIKKLQDDFKESILSSNKEIQEIKNEQSPYFVMIHEEQNNILNKKEEKETINKSIKEKKLFKLHIDYIKDSYGNKNKIKAFWISHSMPDFNKYLKYYLDYFEVSDKLEFSNSLTPKMDRWSYLTHSGGECMKIDLCLMFALNDLQISNFGPQSNVMVLDEVDGKLDPFTINKLVSLLNEDIIKRNDGLTNILIISHRIEMKDRFPHRVRVKNKQERAYIEHG